MKRTRKIKQTSIGDGFIGTRFGPDNCLEVVAWCGERVGSVKKYTVFCSVCAEDPELFGLGLFLITKNKIQIGRIPCGCSKSVFWTEDQYIVKIKREIEKREFKYEFLGFAEDFKGQDTKLHLSCEFGESKSASISNFLRGQSCKARRDVVVGLRNRKEDQAYVDIFMSTGAYPQGTLFQRSDRRDKNGWLVYWNVTCPLCDETYEASGGNLTRGTRGCSCSQRLHNKAYIHLIELNSNILGVKFGITSMTIHRRLHEQNRKSVCKITEYGVWDFTEVSACRRAERFCKELYNRFIDKSLLPDGYTETAPFEAIETIISIYESNGGVRVNDEKIYSNH